MTSDGGGAGRGSGGVIRREELLARIQSDRPLIAGYPSLEDQLQPNGFDMSVAQVSRLQGRGSLGRSNAERVLPGVDPMPFDTTGWLDLEPGAYQILFNEVVDLPNDLMALGRPRSSLCRCGATMGTAVWDAGYRGRSTALLIVEHQDGLRLALNARIMQLVFLSLNGQTERGYDGVYQDENIGVARASKS